MDERFIRTELMFGKDAMNKLKNAKIAIFGVGGVGGYVVEILARAGIGNFTLFDNDTINITNINRQIIATTSTLGQNKIDAFKNRILDINPEAKVETINCFYLPENADNYDLSKFDYVVDCIDTITAKIELAVRCKNLKVPIISSMGSRNKLDYSKYKVSDLSKTNYDKLAKVMRLELKKRGIKHLKVVYSDEDTSKIVSTKDENGKFIESSPLGPSILGIILGGEVMKDIIYDTNHYVFKIIFKI